MALHSGHQPHWIGKVLSGSPRPALLREWLVAGTLAGAVAGPLFLASITPVGLPLALIFGVAQWLTLRRHVSDVGYWIPVTMLALVIGWCAGGLVFTLGSLFLLSSPAHIALLFAAVGCVGGAVIGVVQVAAQLDLRDVDGAIVVVNRLTSSQGWVLASAVGWAALFGLIASQTAWNGDLNASVLGRQVIAGALGGLLYAAATGAALLRDLADLRDPSIS